MQIKKKQHTNKHVHNKLKIFWNQKRKKKKTSNNKTTRSPSNNCEFITIPISDLTAN